jgi:hypothetical protein
MEFLFSGKGQQEIGMMMRGRASHDARLDSIAPCIIIMNEYDA